MLVCWQFVGALRTVARRAKKKSGLATLEWVWMAAGQFEGRVAAIRGAVIDLVFDRSPPPIEDAVEILDSEDRVVVAEIQAHLDPHAARAIALEPTTGLRRGDRARGAGGPVTIAVGEAT